MEGIVSLVGEAGRVDHSPASGKSGETGGVPDTKKATPASAYVSWFVPSPPPVNLPPASDVSPSSLAVTTREETKSFLSKNSQGDKSARVAKTVVAAESSLEGAEGLDASEASDEESSLSAAEVRDSLFDAVRPIFGDRTFG